MKPKRTRVTFLALDWQLKELDKLIRKGKTPTNITTRTDMLNFLVASYLLQVVNRGIQFHPVEQKKK